MDHIAEIENARSSQSLTRRPTVAALEDILFTLFPVLDHGFVRVVDYMGDDAAVVQAARVSYGRGTRKITEDNGLIRYLMRHRHSTPFEMCELKLDVKLPIFVARQWVRHRTASINEISARYSILDREFYIPEPEHLAAQAVVNRQGRGGVLGEDEARQVRALLVADASQCFDHYDWMLNEGHADPERDGLARELARMNLTLNTFTRMYWKTDLHNLFGFLSLRADPHAQFEIRAYADVMLDITRKWVPASTEAFNEYRLGAFTLSSSMVSALAKYVGTGCKVSRADTGLSARDWAELNKAFPIGTD